MAELWANDGVLCSSDLRLSYGKMMEFLAAVSYDWLMGKVTEFFAAVTYDWVMGKWRSFIVAVTYDWLMGEMMEIFAAAIHDWVMGKWRSSLQQWPLTELWTNDGVLCSRDLWRSYEQMTEFFAAGTFDGVMRKCFGTKQSAAVSLSTPWVSLA